MSKVLVNIHGAGNVKKNFSEQALGKLTNILGTEPACIPCWYADPLATGIAARKRRTALPPEAEQFHAALIDDMLKQQQQFKEEQIKAESLRQDSVASRRKMRAVRSMNPMELSITLKDAASDVVRYLFDANFQHAAMDCLTKVLNAATRDYDETILVSHSLGTLVAYDVLLECADQYRISRFITMGSPLRKAVAWGLRSSDVGAIKPPAVPFWRNLYDTTDWIADAIGPAFPSYLIEDVFIQVADTPVESHDYWHNRQILEMIAGWLR